MGQSLKCTVKHQFRLLNSILIFPEIVDYEIRRELLRAGKTKGIKKLDSFRNESRIEQMSLDSLNCFGRNPFPY